LSAVVYRWGAKLASCKGELATLVARRPRVEVDEDLATLVFWAIAILRG